MQQASLVFFFHVPSVPLTPTKGEGLQFTKQRQQLAPSNCQQPAMWSGLPYLVPGTTPVGGAAGACVLVLALGCASSVWKEQQLQCNSNCTASERTKPLQLSRRTGSPTPTLQPGPKAAPEPAHAHNALPNVHQVKARGKHTHTLLGISNFK